MSQHLLWLLAGLCGLAGRAGACGRRSPPGGLPKGLRVVSSPDALCSEAGPSPHPAHTAHSITGVAPTDWRF